MIQILSPALFLLLLSATPYLRAELEAGYYHAPVQAEVAETPDAARGKHSPAQLFEQRRPVPLFELPDSGYVHLDEAGSADQSHKSRQGRLTREERRALRRQINEAGHDLYSQGR